jgi:Dyp-type peroxidase family
MEPELTYRGDTSLPSAPAQLPPQNVGKEAGATEKPDAGRPTYLPSTTPTRQFAGLVLAPVLPSMLGDLRKLLAEIGRETSDVMRGRPPANTLLPFHEIESIHYARLVLVEQPDATAPLLAFSTNYDGPEGESTCSAARARRTHIADLVRQAGPGLERVFACCQGFRPGRLEAYLFRYQRKASTFYVGSSGRSRNQILWEAELRRRVDAILDARDFAKLPAEAVQRAVLERLAADEVMIPTFPEQPDLTGRVVAAKTAIALIALALVAATAYGLHAALPADTFRGGPVRGMLGTAILALLTLGAVAGAFVWRFRRLETTDAQFQPEFSLAAHQRFATAAQGENQFLQNQLSHLVRIKPGLLRPLLIRIVFAGLQFLARNVYNHGKLGGIPSIHFARWVLIPKRGVLFFSNFDSSWESYLGDFIDQASSGLTAVWSNTVGYPRTDWLLTAGSRDAARFLAWTRHHQIPSQVWYSAYPGLSIANVNVNTEIRRGLGDPAAMDPVTWLFKLRGIDRRPVEELYSAEQTREPPLPLKQIQGIVLKGYGQMKEARYLMLAVTDRRPGLLDWLSRLPLTSAADVGQLNLPDRPLVNIAFSYRGLLAIGLDPALCASFATPFVQGADHEYRARANGDVGPDAPDLWAWGSAQRPVDLLLLVYAKDAESVERAAADHLAQAAQVGLTLMQKLEGNTLPGRKEHFGFRDGIAQPTAQGSGRPETPGNTLAAGEFLLGHRDGYGNVAHSPISSSGFAFGTNGSYLVFRQLEQDVAAFWRHCVSTSGAQGAITMASKMVGRWPSGAPLVRHPDKDPDDPRFIDEDDFSYSGNDEANDRYGARCPFGAHIRRSNPRDWQLGADPKESLELANLHRIIRRGRPYGPPFVPSMAAADLIEQAQKTPAAPDPAGRGLQFLCFNAQIDRQFEFIQQQWCNNPKFGGQVSDPDPLLGLRRPPEELGLDAATFTLQSDVKEGLGLRAHAVQKFVRVLGSAYLFMPSISAVRLLRENLQQPTSAEGLEKVPADEQLHIDSLITTLREKMKREYAGRQTLRDAHPKMHGCVKATFTVARDLSPSLQVGIFAEPGREYRAWVRFSNADGAVSPDTKPDIRGVAIKLMGVPQAKLLDGEEDSTTHDFLLISHDAFVTKDAAEFDGLVKGMVRGKFAMLSFLFRRPRVLVNLLRSLARHTSPLAVQYFSVAPYLFGTRAVKYTLKPAGDLPSVPHRPEAPDHLRLAMRDQLAQKAASFDFMVQPQSADPRKTPIEDPGRAWRERDAPFFKVATLSIERQEFDTPERKSFAENLSFNPWRCLPEHRPLGGISRARRQVYRALSSFRHDRNAAARREPEDPGPDVT